MLKPIRLVSLLAAVSLLGACASRPPVVGTAPVYGASSPTRGAYAQFGQVTRIEAVNARNNTTGTGAVVGGVTGAVVGREFGGSSGGRAQGAVLGAIAGALIGNEIEKDRAGHPDVVRISVTLDNGATREFDYRDAGGLRVGDRVRVEGDRLFRR